VIAKTETKLVEVTDEDIVNGIQSDPCHCPIARAIQRTTGLSAYVEDVVWVNGQMAKCPDIVLVWVHCFDSGELMKPFSFNLMYWDY
jgi:hypothetical protein